MTTPDPDLERLATEALCEAARNFSPKIQQSGGGRVHLDLGRLRRDEEPELCRSILCVAEESANLSVRVGIADTRLAATLATCLSEEIGIVPPGGEERFLENIDIRHLQIGQGLLRRLEHWGVFSLGDLSALPRHELQERLGPSGLHWQDISRGREHEPLVVSPFPERLEDSIDLDWVLPSAEPLLFLLRASIDRLRRLLSRGGVSCRRIELESRLDTGTCHRNVVTLRSPSRDPKVLWTLIHLELEKNPPRAGITGFTIRMVPSDSHELQLPLFGLPEPRRDRLEAILARLLSLLGKETRRGSLHLKNSHRPETYSVVPFEPRFAKVSRDDMRAVRATVGLRRITPATECITLEALRTAGRMDSRAVPFLPAGCVRRLPHRMQSELGSRTSFEGGVRRMAGPWTLMGEWWTTEPFGREYWDVELGTGFLLRALDDTSVPAWRVDGAYD